MASESVNSGSLALPTDRLSSNLLSAIFDSISTPFETIKRKKSGGFVVTLQNVEDLFHRIDQVVQQYQLRGMRCDFVLSVEEGGVYRFTSLTKLQGSNLAAMTKQVIAIGINFDILIIPPKSDVDIDEPIPQRFKLEIGIEDPLRAIKSRDDYSFLGLRLRQPEINSAEIRIEYSEYAVSRTLLAVSEEWLDGLKTDTLDTIGNRKRSFLAKSSSLLSGFLPISAMIGGIIFEPADYANIFTPMRYLLLVILMAVVMIFLGAWAEERISKILYILTPRTSFSFSSGDLKTAQNLSSLRKKSWRNLAVVFIGIILSGVIGLFVNLISQKIFG